MQQNQSAIRFPRRFDPQVGRPHPTWVSETMAHHVSVPKYAAEQGLDPQADFTNRPKSQGLLGSVVLLFPSGASRVLDRHTP